ncbi:MAG: histone deacetylase family protein [Pseudomonadota bacterium]
MRQNPIVKNEPICAMIAYFDPLQNEHRPENFLVAGNKRPSPDVPERASLLLAGAKAAGWRIERPSDYGKACLGSVHSAAYLHFLETIYDRWREIEGAGPEVIPNVHPIERDDTYPISPIGQAGFHQADTACPIGPNTFVAAHASAQTALAAAETVALHGAPCYALCRPPGHHACRDRAGGFCFLNNAAIAAAHLTQTGWRVAILDIDVHHGNGTQDIFYDRADVLTVSLHTDPNHFYPFFRGHAQEIGHGPGEGANLNLPLARGTDFKGYRPALETALTRISDFGAQIIVVALGLDTHISDPFRGMAFQTADFIALARAIAAIEKPLVIVQEGGYVSDDLTSNLTAFLTGIG